MRKIDMYEFLKHFPASAVSWRKELPKSEITIPFFYHSKGRFERPLKFPKEEKKNETIRNSKEF